MACRYYDDILVEKIKRWIPDSSTLRVLKPDESKRLFELTADDLKDNQFKLPLVALSRSTEIELLSNVKSPRSFDGIRILSDDIKATQTALFNVIPIKLNYNLDIYTKTAEEGDEYIRTFIFKLLNNPVIKVTIPYNNFDIEHIANIRVGDTVSDTSAISERIFSGQFTRWTIQLEIQDAFLFSIPYRKNWRLSLDETEVASLLEISPNIRSDGEIEILDLK